VPSHKKQSSLEAAERTDMKGSVRCLKCDSCWSALPAQRNLTVKQSSKLSVSVEITSPEELKAICLKYKSQKKVLKLCYHFHHL